MNINEVIVTTITTRIPDDLNEALTKIAEASERSKSYIVLKAIQNYILEIQEDIEDYNDAMAILSKNEQTIPLDKVIQNLGLKNLDFRV